MMLDMMPVAFDAVEPLQGEWVWGDHIPTAEVTIAAGAGGVGKGMLCCDLAARVSRGEPLPGDTESYPPSAVIWISAEDDSNVVTANRLRAAGADLTRIFDLSEVNGTAFTLPEHIPALADAVRATEARLVILDPLAGVAPVSLSSVTKVRSILTPVRDLARATGAAVLITHHLTKDGKISGSPAVIDGVRSVLTVARDKQDPNVRAVSVLKSNMGADAPVVRYKIQVDDDGGSARVQYVSEDEIAQPLSGQDKILAVLTAEPMSGQAIATATGIEYSTVRVLMSRMIASGKAASPTRGWFTLAEPAVTTAGQDVTALTAVANGT
jgi:hypothetical protein